MSKAHFVRDLDGFAGNASLYRLEPPMGDKYEYVVTSAACVPYSGPETYIFPSNENGEITSWGELTGSYRGGLSHEKALRRAGYEIAL